MLNALSKDAHTANSTGMPQVRMHNDQEITLTFRCQLEIVQIAIYHIIDNLNLAKYRVLIAAIWATFCDKIIKSCSAFLTSRITTGGELVHFYHIPNHDLFQRHDPLCQSYLESLKMLHSLEVLDRIFDLDQNQISSYPGLSTLPHWEGVPRLDTLTPFLPPCISNIESPASRRRSRGGGGPGPPPKKKKKRGEKGKGKKRKRKGERERET